MLFMILLFISAAIATAWAYNKVTTERCKTSRHMVGKVIIVTGANGGIGFETAKDLADRGAKVILACRDERRGMAAREQIVQATGNQDVHYRNLDLSSLASVRRFAEEFLKTEKRLDVLINNAGVFGSPYEMTQDGLLLEMQTNHFGPFLLTNLLLPLLKSSAPSRIINVASVVHQRGKIELGNLNMEKEADKTANLSIYNNSKLCNILMSLELSKKLQGSGVTVNSLHPGIIASDLLRNKPLVKFLAKPVMALFFKTPWEGAQTTIHCAVAPELGNISGRYFSECKEVKPSAMAQDEDLARRLWVESEKLVKLK